MANDFSVIVGFQAKYDSVTQAFNKLAQGTDKVVKDNKKVEKSFDDVGKHGSAAGNILMDSWKGIAAGLAGVSLTAFFNRTADAIDRLTDTARGLGVSAESFQKLAYGAKLGGVGMDELGDSLKKFNIVLGQALSGNDQAIESFKNLGINVENLRGMDLADQYAATAAAAAKVKDSNVAAANAMQIFGKAYTNALSLGRDGLQENVKEFDELGVKLTDTQRKAVDAFGDAKTKLGTLFEGFAQKVVAQTSPAFQSLVDGVSNFIQESGGIEGLATDVGNKIVEIVQSTIDTFNALKPGFQSLLGTLNTFVSIAKDTFNEARDFANNFSDRLSNPGVSNFKEPGIVDFLSDFGGGSAGPDASYLQRALATATNLVYPYSVTNGLGANYDPTAAGQPGALSKYGTGKSPYSQDLTPKLNLIANTATAAIKTSGEKASKALDTFSDSVKKSSDSITSAFKALENKDLSDAINRIFGIISGSSAQTPEQYDQESQAGVNAILSRGIGKTGGYLNAREQATALETYNATRKGNRVNAIQPTTSSEFDKKAAELIQNLKEGLGGEAFRDSLKQLSLQSNSDLLSGTGRAEQQVIDEIQKYASSLGADKQKFEVGITVTPTKDFAVKVFTNADALPYIASAVAQVATDAAATGALS